MTIARYIFPSLFLKLLYKKLMLILLDMRYARKKETKKKIISLLRELGL